MIRFVALLAFALFCCSGCSGLFNPDIAISKALADANLNSTSIDGDRESVSRGQTSGMDDSRIGQDKLSRMTPAPESGALGHGGSKPPIRIYSADVAQSNEPTGSGSRKPATGTSGTHPDRQTDRHANQPNPSIVPVETPVSSFPPNQPLGSGTDSTLHPVDSSSTARMSENLDTSRQSQPIPDANRHDSDPLGEPGSEGGIPKSIEAASPVSRKPVQLDGRRADRVQQQLRTIYDTINRYDLPKPNPLLQPLIQRPVFSAPSGTNDSEKTPIDIDPDSAITWKDSLEATIEHLKDELGSLDPRSQDAVDLTHYLNVLDSLGSNQSFVDLASRLEELRSELPPHQFQAIEHLINGSGKAGSSLIAQLKTAVNQVAKTANLQLVNAAFCTQVDGFGDYVPFEQNRFRPDDEVLLYCELENFSQEPVNDPHSAGYRCRFDAQLEFLNADGSFDFVKSYTDIKDVCRNQREDFYLFFRFRIPRLKTGMHRLQIRITDKVGRKNATLANPITFEVAEPPAE